MENHLPSLLPHPLLSAVFQPKGYPLETNQWDGQMIALSERFASLPKLSQQLLTAYYSKGTTISELARGFDLSAKQCSKELHRALHELRKRANPLYKSAIETIHTF